MWIVCEYQQGSLRSDDVESEGSDPLPFQWLSKDATRCGNVTFVDIDYPELITKKCKIVTNTPQLRDLLHNPTQCTESDGLSLQSEEYLALGCDLRDIKKLEAKLVEKLDVVHCLILFTAEVSIVYTDVDAADALIAWAARYENGTLRITFRYIKK